MAAAPAAPSRPIAGEPTDGGGPSEVHAEPPETEPKQGDTLEALDAYGTWCVGTVRDRRGNGEATEVHIHFCGWTSRHDEWVGVNSGRLRAVGGGKLGRLVGLQCSRCKKWRLLRGYQEQAAKRTEKSTGKAWECALSPDAQHSSCEVPQQMDNDEMDRLLGMSGEDDDAASVVPGYADDDREAVATEECVQCDRCSKWRRLTAALANPDDGWHCALNVDPAFNSCDVDEELWSDNQAPVTSGDGAGKKTKQAKKCKKRTAVLLNEAGDEVEVELPMYVYKPPIKHRVRASVGYGTTKLYGPNRMTVEEASADVQALLLQRSEKQTATPASVTASAAEEDVEEMPVEVEVVEEATMSRDADVEVEGEVDAEEVEGEVVDAEPSDQSDAEAWGDVISSRMPSVGQRIRVLLSGKVTISGRRQTLDGAVTACRVESMGEQAFKVAFDNGGHSWHASHKTRWRPLSSSEEAAADVLCVGGQWELLELSCALTRQRLTSPARGVRCRHPANCNHDALRRHATSTIGRRDGAQPCPIIGCPEVLRRSGDAVCDEALAAKLIRIVPAHVRQVWVRGDELRLDPPAASGGAASSSAAASVDLT